MNEIANRHRNIIAAIDNLLIQLERQDPYIEIMRDFHQMEMEYHQDKEGCLCQSAN